MVREDTRRNHGRKPDSEANDRPHPRCKPNEGEYNIPFCIAFVNYEKAFDSVQTQAVQTSLQEQEIEDVYIELLKETYTNISMTVHLHKESNKINIRRGVRHRDTISPKLFTAALESIYRRLTWETGGLTIDGEYLNYLRFADDILIDKGDDGKRHTNICQ